MNVRNIMIVAILLLGGSILSTGAAALQPPPKGLTQQEALERISQGVKLPVIAEVVAPERRLPESTSFNDREAAWKALSVALDLHVVRRPGGIALHRRYTDLLESPDLPREELRRTFTDLDTLLRPFVPYSLDVKYIERQNAFANNLATAQIERMRSGGLPFTQLSREQQSQWLQISAASVYSQQDLVFQRTARKLNRWQDLDLTWHPAAAIEDYLAVTEQSQDSRINLTHNCRRTFSHATLPGAVEERVERSGLPSAWRERVKLTSGEMDVSALVTSMERATRLAIEVPGYSAQNRLIVFPGEARAVDVAAALEDIYGWQLRYVRGKSWILDRPRFGPARDPVELHANMQRAIPPQLRVMFGAGSYRSATGGSLDLIAASHRALIYQRMMVEINRAQGTAWKKLHIAALPETVQRKVANLLPLVDALDELMALCRSPLPKARLVAPQEGWFTVGGEPGQPLKGTAIMFHVKGPEGKTSSWGWAVGTSSLEQ